MSNRDLPMMPWYPDQFEASSRAMTWLERCLYRTLLDAQWQLGALPTDLQRLQLCTGWPQQFFNEAWPGVKDKFVKLNASSMVNKRLEEHRARAHARKERLAEAGRKGGFSKAATAVPQPRRNQAIADMPRSSSPSISREERARPGPRAARAPAEKNGSDADAWAELKTRAEKCGFRPPFDADTVGTYETALRLYERDYAATAGKPA